MDKKIIDTSNFLKNKGFENIRKALILNSEDQFILDELTQEIEISFDQLGLEIAELGNKNRSISLFKHKEQSFLVIKNNYCYYEGYQASICSIMIRVLKELGINHILRIDSGFIFSGEQIVEIDDHINLSGNNPLIGKNIERYGVRFPDMSNPYQAFSNLNKAVLVGLSGPTKPTEAEKEAYQIIGAKAASFCGIVYENIVANHAGIKFSALVHQENSKEIDPNLIKKFLQ